MKSYRDLEIYKESKKLAIEIHKMTLTLPRFELYEEGGQVRRSSKSITSCIVEGYGRSRYKAEFVKYLIYSHAECDESIVHLEFLFETGYLLEGCTRLSKKINKFIQWVEENWNEDK